MSDPATLWAPVVVGRTYHSDTWWRAQPGDLDEAWRARLWRAVLGRGQAHRLQEGARFLLARNRAGRVFVAVADMTANFHAEFGADRAGRPLQGMVGWLSDRPPRPAEIPRLDWLTGEGRGAAAEEFARRLGNVWTAPDGHALSRPVPSEYGPAPWPADAGDRAEAPPPPRRSAGDVLAYPADQAAAVWAALAVAAEPYPEPYTLVTGWPSAGTADLAALTHLTAAGLTAETRLRVPDAPPEHRTAPPVTGRSDRARPDGARPVADGRAAPSRRVGIVAVVVGGVIVLLLLPLPVFVKLAAAGASVLLFVAYTLIRNGCARLRALVDGTDGGPAPRPATGAPSGARPPADHRWTVRPRGTPTPADPEELL